MNTKKKRFMINLITYAVLFILFIVLTVMINNKSISRTLKGQLIPICSWIVMAVSLNLVVGISGELSLGHAGFMGIGAFTGIIVSGWLLNGFQMEDPALRLLMAIVAGGVIAGIFGALIGIPVLRLRGDYLAIVTLAFGDRNWVRLGGFSLQPSELAKIAFIAAGTATLDRLFARRNMVLFVRGASSRYKDWGTENYLQLARELKGRGFEILFLYVVSEDGAFTAECAAEDADGAVALTADDGSLLIVDLDAGIASRL